ncbi:Deneddylase UL48 [Cocos nucifera]|uniref:Deneddylase UL48 n=1 Tax=Cocos nucifera TaxID=13894 RepID=A0A8K0ITV2_COCNU|nr:Deneddylase UL48 [Cocos nucifera]
MSSSSAASTPPPPSAAKKGFIRRIVPLLLAANLGIGVYILTRTSMRQPADKDEKVLSSPVDSTGAPVPDEKKSSAEPPSTPMKVLPPIPENEQGQLFEWILEEVRKVKPHDPAEKKKNDEEKALLKRFIHVKSIPVL